MTKIVPTDKARQGHWGSHLLVILVVALILAALAWGAAEIYGRMIEPAANAASGMSTLVAHSPAG